MADRVVGTHPGVLALPDSLFVVRLEARGTHWVAVEAESHEQAASHVAFIFDGTDQHIRRALPIYPPTYAFTAIPIDRVLRPKANFLRWLDGQPEEDGADDGP